jgi:isochorismate pyruvate lyase
MVVMPDSIRHPWAAAKYLGLRIESAMTAKFQFPCSMTSPEEPAPHSPPVRRFKSPGYVEIAGSLGELRDRIDALDAQIVALLAERAACVCDATRFKRDAFQVAAPQRQAEVLERVRTLAQSHAGAFPDFPDIIESIYRAMVAGFVAGEAQLFQDTERIDP